MKTVNKSLAIFSMTSFLLLVTTSVLFGQIQIEGNYSEGYGGAGWDADGTGPEPYGNGHAAVFYYSASRDYVEPDALGGAHLLDGMTGFPYFEQALADFGYSAEDIVIKMALCSMGDDVEGEDWFQLGTAHYCNFYPLSITLALHGEVLITATGNYTNYYKTSPSSSWYTESSYMNVEKAGNYQASIAANLIADAFIEDLGGQELRFFMTTGSVPGVINTNGRNGAVYDITGTLEKGLPEFPLKGLFNENEGFVGWDADGSGPEPYGDGHDTQLYYGASVDYDGINPDPDACLGHLLDGAEGFRNTLLQLEYRGFVPGDLKIKAGLSSLGPDVNGEDWGSGWTNYYDNAMVIELAGEPILMSYADTNVILSAGTYWESYTSISRVENISATATPDAQFVALSFMKDLGTHYLKLLAEQINYAGDYEDPAKGRSGAYYQIESGMFRAVHEQATFIDGGSVEGVWTAENSPYYIEGDVTIGPNDLLLIEDGARIAVRGPYTIELEGSIKAEGTSDENILFTASNPNINWDGIDINGSAKNDIGDAIFDHCIFQYGLAQGGDEFNSGGAIALRDYDKLKVLNSTFRFNKAPFSGNYPSCGGAISMWNSKPFIQKCIFHDNVAGDYGGAIFNYSHSEAILSNCLIFNNYADKGGALAYYSYSGGILMNNTITENNAAVGGAIYFYNLCEPEIVNTIIWGNEASASGNQVYFSTGCAPDFVYCAIEGGEAGFQGALFQGIYLFNQEEDPLLENTNSAPYYIPSSASPVINAGTPDTSAWYYYKVFPETCLCGNNRIQNGCIDMGPYEVPAEFKVDVDQQTVLRDAIIGPNPVSSQTQIHYTLKENAHVIIETYTLSGQKMKTLLNENQFTGSHTVQYNASDLPAGIYIVKLYIDQKPHTLKLTKIH
jgi:hypothetical protein